MSWQEIAKAAQAEVLDSIPVQWRLDQEKYRSLKDVTAVPETSGILTGPQLQITDLTAVEIVRRIESRDLTAVQVLEAFAARAAIAHQLVNCLMDWFYEDGLRRARELDDSFERTGKLTGPLHGVPVALKDFHFVKGRPTTTGYVSRRNFRPEHDSALIRTLRDAGAVFYCKTTMPQSGMALETVSNLWGRTVNPYNTDLGAGGSSGGDAVLVALKGTPITPSTDLGGSIRNPAAFNGLYAIRPTSDRIPKEGMENMNNGQLSIKLSCGPICHSMEDLEMFTKLINAHPSNKHDVTSVPIPWKTLELSREKLSIGLMKWDGVVMPHPPVLRALEHTKQTLEAAGHEVIEFNVPFDCWDAIQTTFDTYYQSGHSGTMSALEATGEPLIPAFKDLLKVFGSRECTAGEALQLNVKTRAFREKFSKAWNDSIHRTKTKRTIDALICPPAPAVGYPHDFNIYWGYTSLFNLLDYPSVILPVPGFEVNPEQDPVDFNYKPLETNPYDKPNHEIYDPDMFTNIPSTIQVVGRPFEDEELIQTSSVIDKLFHAS
ncbi:hypothetical protein F53441_10450 [Fusarium austroafricanum]|uniref:Amidase domain-containing protein n=1 Tax=Fusarium austroafricanum TaxID=2364996 RepID=A0A8H4K8S9_9HYPO|nr:hypothetical protein F53441_10450 [Fusarium austroafricanum]